MNEIQTFNFKNFGVRTFVDENGNPWFCASDVCKVLGYAVPQKAVPDHCRKEGVLKQNTPTSSGTQLMSYIDERNVYRLVMRSKLPEAEPFQDWVCGDVLPTIRKTGSYGKPQTPALPDFTNPAIAARAWAEQYEKNQKLLEQAKIDTPKAQWCDRVIAANEHMTVTQAAKTLGFPPRKLKDYLRKIGFIYANADTPMQDQIKTGRAVLRYAHYTTSDGNPVEKPYTHITSKGLKWLYDKLVADGLIEHQQDMFCKTA